MKHLKAKGGKSISHIESHSLDSVQQILKGKDGKTKSKGTLNRSDYVKDNRDGKKKCTSGTIKKVMKDGKVV